MSASRFDFSETVRQVALQLMRDGVSPGTGQGRHVGSKMLDQRIPDEEKGRIWLDFLAQRLEAAVREERYQHALKAQRQAQGSQAVAPGPLRGVVLPATPEPGPVTSCGFEVQPPLTVVPVSVPDVRRAAPEGRCGTTGLLSSSCAHCRPEPEQEPSVYRDVRERIQSGAAPEAAVDEILASFGESAVAQFARPAILSIARHEERRVTRRTEQAALVSSTSQSSADRRSARLQLPAVSFKLPGGEKVAWGKASREEHKARMAWTRSSAETWLLDADLHGRAIRLMDEHGARCLDDIPNWTAVLGSVASDPDDGTATAPTLPGVPVMVPA